jgi:hypothetical protein
MTEALCDLERYLYLDYDKIEDSKKTEVGGLYFSVLFPTRIKNNSSFRLPF